MDGYPEAVDREPRPAWQAVAVGLVILLTVAIVGTLVFARLHGQTPPRTGRSLGAVTVTAAFDFTCRLPVTAYGQSDVSQVSDGDGSDLPMAVGSRWILKASTSGGAPISAWRTR